ncbi:YdhK family protein [Corynebacterium kalidii]|uniref:YdhK family protein n=1 Tax=Corynebacterium kalidii TaxID=2931982 RepID=A0A9X2B2D3_9CORY|nr:YdhK family protein [Corynebacterium kalidii]MCJ7858675.1 YdhK family protein [Corynebacterium kalidii]
MKKRLTTLTVAAVVGGALSLSACSSDQNDSTATESATSTTPMTGMDHQGHDAGHMDHPADGGPAPEGIIEAADPTYPVGTDVVLTADHMAGMDGATATIAGAFDTYTYSVSYTPTDGGAPVVDHKWVVQEELADAGDRRLEDGTTVTLTADHMPGMDGAEATIDSSTDETVYMVDYEADGRTMTNHKWVTESEIRPAE